MGSVVFEISGPGKEKRVADIRDMARTIWPDSRVFEDGTYVTIYREPPAVIEHCKLYLCCDEKPIYSD